MNTNHCLDLLNRYLRITVPLGLAVAVYVGLVPLLLTGSMGAAALATQEAEYCKQVQYSTVQYSTVQYSTVQYSTALRQHPPVVARCRHGSFIFLIYCQPTFRLFCCH